MVEENSSSGNKRGGMPSFAVILLIAAAFIVGMFWNKMQSLEKQVADLKGGSKPTADSAQGNQGANQAGNAAQGNAAAQPQLGSAGQVAPVSEDDHVKGNPNADIMLIEYSDYQCPFCSRFHPTMQQVLDEYGDQVGWVYRHFPLIQLHPLAQKGAEAAECVAELGGNEGFWTFTDELLSDTVGTLTDDSITNAALKAGVNQSAFSSCLSSGKYTQKVTDQMTSGQQAGVTGTPGTVILQVSSGKTQLIPGALPFEQIKQVIDSML